MHDFLSLCVLLIAVGFFVGPTVLVVLLPRVVDPAVTGSDEETSSSSSAQSRSSTVDSDETSSDELCDYRHQ